jgi:hypothetical protein
LILLFCVDMLLQYPNPKLTAAADKQNSNLLRVNNTQPLKIKNQ